MEKWRLTLSPPLLPFEAFLMYGSLEFHTTVGRMAFSLPTYSPLATSNGTKVVDEEMVKKGFADATRWLGPAIQADANFMNDICALHTSLTEEDYEFAVRSLGIHYKLSLDERSQRFQRIGKTWQAYLTQWVIDTGQSAKLLRVVLAAGKTYPTELIEPWTRLVCLRLNRQFAPPIHPTTGLPNTPAMDCLNNRSKLQLSDKQKNALSLLVMTRQPSDQATLVKRLSTMRVDTLEGCLTTMVTILESRYCMELGDYLEEVYLPDAWALALKNPELKEVEGCQEALAQYADQAVARFVADCDRVLRRTLDAARAGVNMGQRWNTRCREALRTEEEYVRGKKSHWTQGLRALGYGGNPSPGNANVNSNADAAKREALQAWGIDQLVRWIDGPVTALRTQAAVKKVKAQPAPEKRPVDDKSDASDAETNASDMPHLLPMALSNSAEFLLGELRDLNALAKQLRLHQAIDPWLTNNTAALQAIADAGQSPNRNHEAEQALLTQADCCLSGLRNRLVQVKTKAELSDRFESALAQALRSEPLVLGKRKGGIINCPLPVTQWALVHERYHQRLLPLNSSVAVDDVALPLGSDQALALYVTGSSQSGYAFDISVHLWNRRMGKTSQPSAEQGAYPRMNQEDWFDTYQPCCVLHVPRGK